MKKKGDHRKRARTSYVRYQDATITPGRHMQETEIEYNSLNSMKVLLHLAKTPMSKVLVLVSVSFFLNIQGQKAVITPNLL